MLARARWRRVRAATAVQLGGRGANPVWSQRDPIASRRQRKPESFGSSAPGHRTPKDRIRLLFDAMEAHGFRSKISRRHSKLSALRHLGLLV
jgi:hypothetical protein